MPIIKKEYIDLFNGLEAGDMVFYRGFQENRERLGGTEGLAHVRLVLPPNTEIPKDIKKKWDPACNGLTRTADLKFLFFEFLNNKRKLVPAFIIHPHSDCSVNEDFHFERFPHSREACSLIGCPICAK